MADAWDGRPENPERDGHWHDHQHRAGVAMISVDTSAEAVGQILSALREGPNLMFDADVADFIEALAADRDRLAAENARLREALRGLLLVIENDDLIPETVSYMRNARAALTGGKDNG